MRIGLYVLLVTFMLATPAAAQQTVFVVRHAERADLGTSGAAMMASDPDLADAGRARAESLATVLRDANITAIFTTEFKRSRQTAAPLAKALGIDVTTIGAREPAKLAAALKEASGNVLVVGHSNTLPAIIKDLGVSTPVTIGEADYDNLFIITTGSAPRMVRLHYQ